jgi:ABC-2 type transport system permease protein
MTDLGPFGILPQLPAEEFDAVPFLAVLGAAAAAGAVGLAGFRRRDLLTV